MRASNGMASKLHGLLLAVLLLAGGAWAGDEDLSPNAYQEFDPVTGFMVTVDPDADEQQGHGDDVAAQAEHGDAALEEIPPEDNWSGPSRWIYWAVVAAAALGVAFWLRRKAVGLTN